MLVSPPELLVATEPVPKTNLVGNERGEYLRFSTVSHGWDRVFCLREFPAVYCVD
jgi:hypothetical protein